jgi:ABC-type Fe3+-siderophore transport system permease subunit
MTDEQFKAIVRELRIVQIILAIMVVILIFIAGWLQP